MNASNSDRRSSERHDAVTNRAGLEWCQGGDLHESAGRLVIISEAGAQLVAGSPPPLRQAVWGRREGPAPTEWVMAAVVRHGVRARSASRSPNPARSTSPWRRP
jgi:hypothetical protein